MGLESVLITWGCVVLAKVVQIEGSGLEKKLGNTAEVAWADGKSSNGQGCRIEDLEGREEDRCAWENLGKSGGGTSGRGMSVGQNQEQEGA